MIDKEKLFTIGDKDFFSVEETGIPVKEMKNHATWIHPKFKEACGLTDEDIAWMKEVENEINFQKAVDMATGFLPVRTEEDLKFIEKWIFAI